MAKLNINKFKTHLCRLCLAQTSSHFSLINNEKASVMLEALTSMKIQPADEISTVMCLKCHLNLHLAYKIQQGMIQAEKKFYERLTIKQEQNIEDIVEVFQENLKPHSKMIDKVTNQDKCVCGKSPSTGKHMGCDEFNHLKKKLSGHESPTSPADKDEVVVVFGEEIIKSENVEIDYACAVCSRTFPTRQLLVRHKYNHVRRKCPICSKEITASNLHTHIAAHNSPPQVCELCGAILKTKDNLRQHMFYSHSASRHKCKFCGKEFKKKSTKDTHEIKEHIGEANFVCDTCGKKFYTVRNLNTHVKMTHLKLRPYVCDFCNSRFSSSFAMKTHRRQHTNETPYKCDVCGDGFRQKVSLKSHLKSKHNIVESVTCECEVCGKGFASKVALYTHKRLH